MRLAAWKRECSELNSIPHRLSLQLQHGTVKQKAHFHLQCLAAILPIIIGFNEYRKELVDLMNAFQTIPHHLFFKTHWMRFTTLIEL